MQPTISHDRKRNWLRRLRLTGLLFAPLLLAGCSTAQQRLEPYRASPPVRPAIGRSPLALPELPPRVALVGIRAGELEQILGRPSLRRREPPAEYWRYSFTGCILDVFLYRSSEAAIPKVVYFEFRNVMRAPGLDGCPEFASRFEPPHLPEVQEH